MQPRLNKQVAADSGIRTGRRKSFDVKGAAVPSWEATSLKRRPDTLTVRLATTRRWFCLPCTLVGLRGLLMCPDQDMPG